MNPEETVSPQKGRRLVVTILVVIFALLALIGGTAFLGWNIFVKRSDGPVIRKITNILPIPAARLGSRVVLYRDFVHARDTLKKFLASPAAKEEKLDVPFDASLEQNTLEKLLVQEALEEIAEQQKVTVTDDELRQYYSEVLSATSSTDRDPSQYLLENFGWDEEDFRQNVLRPALLEQKLTAAMTGENAADADALNRAVAARMEQKDVVRYVRF
ncbi:MAG: SurA N-terminal domain-containing protein [Patescibacteria group bacterium]